MPVERHWPVVRSAETEALCLPLVLKSRCFRARLSILTIRQRVEAHEPLVPAHVRPLGGQRRVPSAYGINQLRLDPAGAFLAIAVHSNSHMQIAQPISGYFYSSFDNPEIAVQFYFLQGIEILSGLMSLNNKLG